MAAIRGMRPRPKPSPDEGQLRGCKEVGPAGVCQGKGPTIGEGPTGAQREFLPCPPPIPLPFGAGGGPAGARPGPPPLGGSVWGMEDPCEALDQRWWAWQ